MTIDKSNWNVNPKPVHFNVDSIAKLFKGAVVQHYGDGPNWRFIGHVEGFEMNDYDELMVVVKFCNGNTETAHHTTLRVF